jgi:hypothetical protein
VPLTYRSRTVLRASAAATAVLLALVLVRTTAADGAPTPSDGPTAAIEVHDEITTPELTSVRESDPDRTVVEDADGAWVATFTDGAHTVALAGPTRTFDEPSADHGVTTDVWVRLLTAPFDGEVDETWLAAALEDPEPDVLGIATEYLEGVPDVFDEDGELVSAAASYGPLQPDGSRPVGSDWHDFRGVDARYGDRVDPADPEEYRALDCSGYTRIVYGFRAGLPLSLRPDGGTSLPRRSFEQAAEAPGVTPISDGTLDADKLQAGDLVFMDSPLDDDGRIDHVGIYVGVDDGGHHRFLHSRPSADGPTIGGDDVHPSILDGDGHYARGFEATRRL